MNSIQSIFQKQEVMLDRKQRSFADDFDRWVRTNPEEQQDDSNTGKSEKTSDKQLTEMNEVMTEAKNETKYLVAKGKKGALIMFWTDALKYGVATSVITVPVLHVLLSL